MPTQTLFRYRYRSHENTKTEAAVIFQGEPLEGVHGLMRALKAILLTSFRGGFYADDVGLASVMPPPAERHPLVDHDLHEFAGVEVVSERTNIPAYAVHDPRSPDQFFEQLRLSLAPSRGLAGARR